MRRLGTALVVTLALVSACGGAKDPTAEKSAPPAPSTSAATSAAPTPSPSASATPTAGASGGASKVEFTNAQIEAALPPSNDFRGFKVTGDCRTIGKRCDAPDGTPGVFIRAIAKPVHLGAPQLAYVSIDRYSSNRRALQALEVIRKREMPVLGRFDISAARSTNGLKLRERGQGTLKPAFDGRWVGLLQRLRLRYVAADGTTSPERTSATVFLLQNRYLVSVALDRWPKSPGPTAYAGVETLVSQVLTRLGEPAP